MTRSSRDLAVVVVVDLGGLEEVQDGGLGDADAAADLDAGQADSASGGSPLAGEVVGGVAADAQDRRGLADGEELVVDDVGLGGHGRLLCEPCAT